MTGDGVTDGRTPVDVTDGDGAAVVVRGARLRVEVALGLGVADAVRVAAGEWLSVTNGVSLGAAGGGGGRTST